MMNKSRKVIAMLFKPEVRIFDEKNIAGCERVFIEDARFLRSTKKLGNVYTAAKNTSVGTNKTKNKLTIKSIHYPHQLLDYLPRIILKIPYLKRITSKINKITIFLAQFFFAVSFILKELKTQRYYVVQVPLVALFFPKKTTVFFHNFYSNLEYVFKIIYLFRGKKENIKFVFVSQSLLKQYLNEYGIINKKNCYILPNAIDTRVFKPIQNKNDKITFIFLSAWVQVKGIYFLPKIIEKVNKLYENRVEFLIGGSVDLWSLSDNEYKKYKKIEDKINNLSKKFSNVKILGLVDHSQISSLLSFSTFCLLPSIWAEPGSLLASESIACGTPVIAFNVGGNNEIISNNKNGYLIDDINVDSFADLVKKVVEKFEWSEYKKMSKCTSLSSKKYSASMRNKRLQKILLC